MGIQINGSTNTISPTSASAINFVAISSSEYINALGNTGGAPNINLSLGVFVTATLNSNAVFTFSNPSTQAVAFTLLLTNDATAGRTITWPGTVSWSGGAVPVRTTTANKSDVYTFFTINGGTNWYGNIAQYNY